MQVALQLPGTKGIASRERKKPVDHKKFTKPKGGRIKADELRLK